MIKKDDRTDYHTDLVIETLIDWLLVPVILLLVPLACIGILLVVEVIACVF